MRRPERFIKKGQTIGPCWICNGQLEVLTNGQGGTYVICPTCQPRLMALEEIAQRAAALATFTQRAQVKELVPWQKVCDGCGTPISSRYRYCSGCRRPMKRLVRRKYMKEWMRKKREKDEVARQRREGVTA